MSTPLSVYKRKPKRLPKSKGFSRYVLDFDGAEDYVEVPDDSSLRPSEITVSLWVKGNFRGDWNGLLYKLDSAEDNGYAIQEEGDVDEFRLSVRSGGTETRVRYIPITSNEWHHIAMTYDGTTLTAYKDGASVGTDTGDLTHTTDRLLIGTRDSLYSQYFDGIIDEVQIYNRALSAEEIRNLMSNYHLPVDMGALVAWWRFEEGTGLTAHDKSGQGNDGTLNPSNDPPIWRDVKKWELRSEVGL